MGLGILEDTRLELVPGTAPLNELGNSKENFNHLGVNSALLKHDSTGTIVLIPQPSDSPNDPYNWSRVKKELFTAAFIYGCGCVGAAGPLLGSAFVPLSIELEIPLQTFVAGVQGGLIVSIAFGSVIFNVLAVKYGKRPIYLMTSLGLALSCFGAAVAKNFVGLVAARVVQGLCMAPMEALVPASIADIWCIHERGLRSALFQFGILAGINLAGPIGGAIIEHGDYKIAFHAMGGAFVLQLIATFFFMPETAFARDDTFGGIPSTAIITDETKEAISEHAEVVTPISVEKEESSHSHSSAASQEARLTWVQEMRPWSGYSCKVSVWSTMLSPFTLLVSPTVMWATLVYTIGVSWLVAISVTISQIFSAPPYNFSITSVGLTNMSAFVAGLLGTILSSPLLDKSSLTMAKMNGGTFEPEFRLPVAFIGLSGFVGVGFFAWGQSAVAGDPWPVPVIVCLGMINLGLQLANSAVVVYITDCHREVAGEAFATMNFVKNMFSFGVVQYINDWIKLQGVKNVFFVMGGITVGTSLFTIPMYIYGKRARSWAHCHNLARSAHSSL